MQSGQPALAYRFKQSARLRLSKARFYFSLLMALRTKTRSDAAHRSGSVLSVSSINGGLSVR